VNRRQDKIATQSRAIRPLIMYKIKTFGRDVITVSKKLRADSIPEIPAAVQFRIFVFPFVT